MNAQPKAVTRVLRAPLFALQQSIRLREQSTGYLETFRYFLNVRMNAMQHQPLTSFHLANQRVALRPMDWWVLESVFLSGEYQFLKDLFPDFPPKVVVDAGANVGLFALYALSLWPNAEVHSIEASPENFAILEINAKARENAFWRTYHCALSDAVGEVPFDQTGLGLGWHIADTPSAVRVPATTLDQFVASHLPDRSISLLKIDIEGAEEKVLRQSAGVLSQVESVVIEVHTDWCNQASVEDILRDLFGHLYLVSNQDLAYPLVVATRAEVTSEFLRPLQH